MRDQQLIDHDILYEALINKDSNFEGIYYVAVKTTGIFCRLTCTARKPKRENVEFYRTIKEAIDYGYRPCKRCQPLKEQGKAPDWLKTLLDEVEDNPGIRLRDSDLRNRGLEPSKIRRWFKKNFNMTFQEYLRTLRISNAFGSIRHGENVINAAFDSGYESLSGFTESFKKTVGMPPVESKSQALVKMTRLTTPLGPMLTAASDKGICLLEFVDRRMIETQIKRLKMRLKAVILPGRSDFFNQLDLELRLYFDGEKKTFDVPLEITGTDFQHKVWDELLTIPYGETRSYSEQARKIGNPSAVRAVASANGDNKIGIIIPCHRVIGADGALRGYGGGLWRKRYLLDLESRNR